MGPSAADVTALLNHGACLRGAFRWKKVGKTNYRAECAIEDGYENTRLRLQGTYNSRTKNLSYTLLWATCRIRSLDVNGPPHQNPDGARVPTPHKHRWTDAHRDREVYQPTDITATDREGILRQFLDECGIRFEGTYADATEQGSLELS